MTSSASTRDLTPIGDSMPSFLRYSEHDGACVRDGCKEDAPFVTYENEAGDLHVIALPCAAHALEDRIAGEASELEHRVQRYMPESGMTERMRGWSFETWKRDCADEDGLAALAIAERWAKTVADTGRGGSLLFFGSVGNGKTGLAWSVIRYLCERGVEAKHVTFRKLLEEMRDAYSARVSVQKYLAGIIRARVLCLDDLGSEVPTPWACSQLLGIVDYRYEAGLPTIFVSNYKPSELAARLGRDDPVVGARILSRMTASATKHEFTAPDRRKKPTLV